MDEYYRNQAGSGFNAYAGQRRQRGGGFFGRLISGGFTNIMKSVLPYLGKKALDYGASTASDILDGQNLKASLKRNLKNTSREMLVDGVAKVKSMRGSGARCNYRRGLAAPLSYLPQLRQSKPKPMPRRKTAHKAKRKPKKRKPAARGKRRTNYASIDF